MSRVEHPDHYQTSAGLEAIDVIEAFFHDSFHLGNVFKYLARAGRKGDYVEDLQKASWYLQREIGRHVPQATEEVARLRDEIDRVKGLCLDKCRSAEAAQDSASKEVEPYLEGQQVAYYEAYLQLDKVLHKEN